jgi:uncharacterized FlaG/YvyC family protein
MSDQFNIGKVGSTPGQDYNYQAVVQLQQNAVAAPAVKNVEQPDKKSESKTKSDEQRKQEQQALRNINNVEMQFDVNSDTNEITLTIMDKETKEIIRTIPERSWGDLSVAELFKVTA